LLILFSAGHRRDAVVAGGIVFAAVATFSLFSFFMDSRRCRFLPWKTGNLQQAVHPLARVYLLATTERGAFFALLMLFLRALYFIPNLRKVGGF